MIHPAHLRIPSRGSVNYFTELLEEIPPLSGTRLWSSLLSLSRSFGIARDDKTYKTKKIPFRRKGFLIQLVFTLFPTTTQGVVDIHHGVHLLQFGFNQIKLGFECVTLCQQYFHIICPSGEKKIV